MKNMLQMLRAKQDEDNRLSPSDLEIINTGGKQNPQRDVDVRDSGYVTDFSPPSATSTTLRQFRFDSEIDEYGVELEEGIEGIDLHDDVFPDESERNANNSEFDDIDNTDKEVEELFSDSGELGSFNSFSQPIEISNLRPGAPAPTPDELHDEQDNNGADLMNGESNEFTDYTISHSFHHTPWNINRHCRRHVFRPISRSVGTQTPSPHSQIIDEAIEMCGGARFQPCRLARGNVVARLHFQSESDQEGAGCDGPLPDVVPFQRDRSASMPEVPALRQPSEQEVGRELRRISDEFHSSFHRVRRRRTMFQHASSFPLNFDLMAYWNSIRRFLSPVQAEHSENPGGQQERIPHHQQDH